MGFIHNQSPARFSLALPGILESEFLDKILPLQVRALKMVLSFFFLAISAMQFLAGKDSYAGLILLFFTAAYICTGKSLGRKQFFVCYVLGFAGAAVALVSLMEVVKSPWPVFFSFLVLMISGVLFIKVSHWISSLTGIVLVFFYLACAQTMTDIGPQVFGLQASIAGLLLSVLSAAGYKLDLYQRRVYLAEHEAGRLSRKLEVLETLQENELVRMNNSLALEIRAHTEAETRLRESEEKYKNLVNAQPEGIFIVQQGRIAFFNPGLVQITGADGTKLTGADPDEVFYEGFSRDAGLQERGYIKGPGGEKIHIEKQIVDISFNSEPAQLFTVRNITDRVLAGREKMRLEKELEKARKMEAFGLLAGGVAHDLNNVLSGIVSTPDLMLMDLPEGSNLIEPVLTMKESGKRAAIIVDELLTLARGTAKVKGPVCLNQVIESYLDSPECVKAGEFHPGVVLKKRLDPGLPMLNASGLHMHKIVMNLVSNAMEAIESRGLISLETTSVTFKDKVLKGYNQTKDGSYIRLRVEDSGPGIPGEDLDRIFDPFYTKKVLGRSGTGLGLTIVWNTVHDHKGYIRVSSGKGSTRFDLFFPVTPAPSMAMEENLILTTSDYTGNNEVILVVDDVKSQQNITANILKRLGYSAKIAACGEDALDFVRENRVDLVVLDMIMDPGINGLTTFRELKKIDPGIRAVIASGYSKTCDVQKAQKLGAGPFIKKPFTLQGLGMAVKEELIKKRCENG